MSKVSLVSLGCPKNLVDSDTLIRKLSSEGFLYSSNNEEADILLVNTCGFIEDAKKESIEEILRLLTFKTDGKKLLVFGCFAKRYMDEIIREIPEIDAIWGVGDEDKIVEYCKAAVNSHKSIVTSENKRLTTDDYRLSTNPYSYLKVSDGCDRGCTYCVIPSIRGPYRSVDPDNVLKDAERLIKSGAKELILVGQDITGYGKDLKGYDLRCLLKDLSSINGDFWIRLLYMYPTSINEPLLELIAEEDKICKYLDIPLQHSEDKILRLMGRGGNRKWHVGLISKIRNVVPEIALRTTFIVGFPGETEEDFNGLKDFVQGMRFERLGVFKYSKEEGTPAASMKGHVSEKIKKKRRDEIMRIQSQISLEKNKTLLGRKFRALIDETDDAVAVARLYSQAPEIDGVVFVEGEGFKKGDFVDIEIKEVYDYDLKGIIIE